MGIEPTFAAWEAAVLPMNYIRVAALPGLHRGTAYHRKDLRATLSTGPLICIIFLAVIYASKRGP